MALKFRIGTSDCPVKDFDISFTQNSVTAFTATVPKLAINSISSFYNQNTAIYFDNQLLISGISYDEETTVDDFGTVWTKVYCYDEIGRLLNEAPLINPENAAIGHFQDEQLVGIIMLLLSGTTTFKVGQFTSMETPLIRTTVDLRDCETRWAQIVKTVNSVPNCFVRYGGYDNGAGRHQLDIGAFGDTYGDYGLDNRFNIIEIKKQKARFEKIREIIAVGGNMSTVPNRPVFLSDALAYDPTLATHVSYPIVTLALGTKAVRNNSVASGATRKKEFSNVKTRNDAAPSAAEINQAGYALWQAAVAQLNKSINSSYEVVGTFSIIPKIGQVIALNGNAYQTIIDPVTLETSEVLTYSVMGNFFIQKVTTSYNDEFEKTTLIVGTSRYANDGDDEIDIYNQLDEVDNIGVATSALTYSIDSGSQNQSGVAANCIQYSVVLGAINGRSFSVALPSPPVGASFVSFAISASVPNVTVTTTTVPALPATGWAGCVSVNNNWTVADNVTITIVFLFT